MARQINRASVKPYLKSLRLCQKRMSESLRANLAANPIIDVDDMKSLVLESQTSICDVKLLEFDTAHITTIRAAMIRTDGIATILIDKNETCGKLYKFAYVKELVHILHHGHGRGAATKNLVTLINDLANNRITDPATEEDLLGIVGATDLLIPKIHANRILTDLFTNGEAYASDTYRIPAGILRLRFEHQDLFD
jgi:hypothetical protein